MLFRSALISGVMPDGPAKLAGIKSGDVIIKFDNKDVEDIMSYLVKEGDLDRFGAGSILALPCQNASLVPSKAKKKAKAMKVTKLPKTSFKKNVVAIYCVLQMGQAEKVAVAVSEAGCLGVNIAYGTGRGIRDRERVVRREPLGTPACGPAR